MHADGAFDSNEQFQLRRVDSTLSTDSNVEDEEFKEDNLDVNNIGEVNLDENIENDCIDENDNCIEEIVDVCMEDECVLADELDGNKILEKEKNVIEMDDKKFKQQINQKHVTKLLVEGSNSNRLANNYQNLDRNDQNDELEKPNRIKTLNKENLSLESDELNCSLEDDDLIEESQENLNNLDNNLDKITNKRRVSILKDYAQSTLMTSTSSGISTSSCSSTLNNKSKDQQQIKILIRCVRIYYSVPYSSFNYKIKCINLIPEYLQDNIVITPETIFNKHLFSDSPTRQNQFEFSDSLITLNSESDQQRINMINLMNATSQNRILEQKRIKQFVTFIKDYLQGK